MNVFKILLLVWTVFLFFISELGFSQSKRISKEKTVIVHKARFMTLEAFAEQFHFFTSYDTETKINEVSSGKIKMRLRADTKAVFVNAGFIFLDSYVRILAGQFILPYDFALSVFPSFLKRFEEAGKRKKFVFYQKKEDFVVILDPGHGGNDPGAVSSDGTLEKDINLDIVLRVSKRLKDKGIKLILTRDKDQFLKLERRVAIAKKNAADLFISIHANAAHAEGASGIEIFYAHKGDNLTSPNTRSAVLLAQAIDKRFNESLGLRTRGIKQGDYHVLRNADYPALIIETGFITNADNLTLLKKVSERELLSDAIADEIMKYYKDLHE